MQSPFQTLSSTRWIKLLILAGLLAVLIVYTLPWINNYAIGYEYSGVDFHAYWYAGHFTRMGINPYWAILLKSTFPVYWDPRYPGSGAPGQLEADLKLPMQYLDGPVVTESPVAQLMITAPSVTAPLNLFMGLFAWLSWPTARTVWIGINIILALLIPWLGFRLIKDHHKINLDDKLIVAFAFYNFYGLRQSLVVGQQSVISLFLLLLALLLRDHWLLAGLLLGIGISKYSIGLPIFLLFLLQKRTRTILVSLAVQFIGVLLLLPYEHGSISETLQAYLKALDLNYSQEGVHLLARFPGHPFIGYLLMIGLLSVLIYLMKNAYFRSPEHGMFDTGLEWNVLSLLTAAIFLAAYHRIHDLPFAIFLFLSLMAIRAGDQQLLLRESRLATYAWWLSMVMLIFPTLPTKLLCALGFSASVVSTFASENVVSTVALLLMFSISAWLILKIFIESRYSGTLEEKPA